MSPTGSQDAPPSGPWEEGGRGRVWKGTCVEEGGRGRVWKWVERDMDRRGWKGTCVVEGGRGSVWKRTCVEKGEKGRVWNGVKGDVCRRGRVCVEGAVCGMYAAPPGTLAPGMCRTETEERLTRERVAGHSVEIERGVHLALSLSLSLSPSPRKDTSAAGIRARVDQ